MEEIVNKFIEEGKQEHEEMEAFIREFRTTNDLLLKERNNSLSNLEFEVYGLSRAINKAQIVGCEAKGVTTRGGKSTTDTICDINNIDKHLLPHHDEPTMPDEPAPFKNDLERCSAVLLNKLLSKEKDPGSFTIPCDIGHLHIDNALADLGASISLMPYTMYEKLGLGELKPTRISLELANRSIQYPRGIAEDVLIKINKFVLLIDFVILDIRENSRILIILGRQFLATARAMIDVFNKKITLKVRSKEGAHGHKGMQSEHLYSASAIEIDEKRPELKDLPSHLEYAVLPNPNRTGRSRENEFYLSLWNFCLQEDAVRIVQRSGNFSKVHDDNIHDMVEDFMEVFVDDFSVFGNVLGHKIFGKGIEVDKAKIDVIAKLPYPTNVKGVRSFLGHAGFYRRFIKDFSMISKPMTQLLMKDARFDFFEDCKKAFNKLKERLTTAPIIISLDWSMPFELMCDASDFAVGAVL
ncbi:reverse transcriptase domain-containing protein [Tanacetum coccineum]|uniref:Reverse transcriptase domain-containing protein n=1 Tax=Tanacetum coccineum TaxID=301880 RepID=A0ABQ5CG94_9ASTR